MTIPSSSNPKWAKLISGEIKPVFKFLAIKLLLGRLNRRYNQDQSPATMNSCIAELIAFFKKNAHLPVANNDLTTIFS